MADRLRQSISDYAFTGQEMLPNHNLTVSIGVAERLGPEDTVQELIERADAALYRAKFFRKNRVELYSTVFDQFTHLDVSTDNSITSVKALITIINSRDHYTYSHTERVVRYCDVFADYCHLSQQDKVHLVYAAYLHDIGKINVKKETLISEKRLTEQEWEEVKRHPVDSADIVSQIPELQEVVPIVMQHHERFDGTGYPNGLRGEEICRLARMLSLADSFDAMTAKRPYQPSRTFEDAFAEIRRCSGTQFDPALSESFIQAVYSDL
ncbi:MAG: HD-GYP domain-containing protein [Clostridiales bacterium]|nr:HD-GYP domain-containing protein [Clostridiales bacterium]